MKNIVFALLLFLTGATVQAGPPQTVLPPFALPYNEGAAKSKQSGAYLVTFVGCKPLDVASSRVVVAHCSNKDGYFENGTVVISKWNKATGDHEWLKTCQVADAPFVVDRMLNPKVGLKKQACNCAPGDCETCVGCPNGQCAPAVGTNVISASSPSPSVQYIPQSLPVSYSRVYGASFQSCPNGRCPNSR